MRSRTLLIVTAAILTAGSLAGVHAQTVFAGKQQQSLPITVGFGMSNFDLDWGWDKNGTRRMMGVTASVDSHFPYTAGFLRGLGLRAEGRDINYLRPASYENLRESTILGGPTFTWSSSRRVRPVMKCLWGMGSIDFPPMGRYSHDTRSVMAPGIGLEARLFGPLWIRGDYEYQFWHKLFHQHDLTPNGFTITTLYDFRPRDRNRY